MPDPGAPGRPGGGNRPEPGPPTACPACGAPTRADQPYCGGCGHALRRRCPACGAFNPTLFAFCGECGERLDRIGVLELDGAGRILSADPVATRLLGAEGGRLRGKPFSLLVSEEDLVPFFTAWNRRQEGGGPGPLTVTLHSGLGPARSQRLRIDWRGPDPGGEGRVRLHIAPADAAGSRPSSRPKAARSKPPARTARPGGRPSGYRELMDRIDLSDLGLSEDPSEGESEPAAAPERMRLSPDPGGGAAARQRAVPVPGGGFRIACTACGRAESVSEPAFARLGFAVTADCPCGHRFPVLRERRGFYRKPVGLEGFFAEGLHADPERATGVVSGPVRVTNLSRTGVELTSARMGLLREGERLTLRFRLDNSAETVILRAVRIVSLNGDRAGCRFEGEDPSDVVLGFYFL